jgi:predicted metal-dependent phosphoesterase TrpH
MASAEESMRAAPSSLIRAALGTALAVSAGCNPDPVQKKPAAADTSAPDLEGIVSRGDGWLRGDLHVHTDYDGGMEDVATVIALAEYLSNETFLGMHPEYAGNQLDYLAITDHRTVEQQSDPGYVSSLILVGGEEFGSQGHAGTHGVHERVDHDPDGDGTTLVDLLNAIDDTHAQGATFSPNHPFLPDISWPWDTRTHDGVEVWNAGWSLMAPNNTLENLEAWEARHGIPASPMYRRAIQETQSGAAFQALAWYEAQLLRGIHLAVIGGSDRHAVLLPGFPTTWIKADSADEAGVVQGIRDRHTFISRTPVSAQVQVSIEIDAEIWEMGDEVPVSDSTTEAIVRVRVGRANGGIVRLIGGGAVDTDEALEGAELGTVLFEQAIDSDDFVMETTLTVGSGDWLYPMVLEPLIAPGITDEQAAEVRSLAEAAAATGEEDFGALATMASAFVESSALLNGAACDPTEWREDRLQCFPPDDSGLGSMFVPDMLDRGLNAVTLDGEMTEWCMGAIGSATRFVAEGG